MKYLMKRLKWQVALTKFNDSPIIMILSLIQFDTKIFILSVELSGVFRDSQNDLRPGSLGGSMFSIARKRSTFSLTLTIEYLSNIQRGIVVDITAKLFSLC